MISPGKRGRCDQAARAVVSRVAHLTYLMNLADHRNSSLVPAIVFSQCRAPQGTKEYRKRPTHPTNSISKSEMRVVISQIIRIRPIQPPVPLASITLLIFHPHTQQQHHTRRSTHPQQAQTRAVTNSVMRCLRSDEDVTRDDPAAIAEADHHGAGDGALVMAGHIILDPGERHRLANVAAADDDEDGEVAHAHCDGVLAEQDDVAY